MTRLSIDDQISELRLDPSQPLSDLLNAVLSTLPPNRIVTDIVLDGHMLSKARAPHLLEKSTEQVKEVQIRTADKEIWAATGLDIALSCLERVQRSLIRAAELFREDNQAKANAFFVHCVEGLERFFEAVVLSRCALKLDFDKLGCDGLTLAKIEAEFSLILRSIMTCQEQQDFIGVADKIEYELITNLCLWNKALNQARTVLHSNA